MLGIRVMLSHSVGLLRKIGEQKTTRDYRHRQSVFEHGDAADALFYIDHGNVKLSVVSQTGKKAIISILRRGEFFGESCLVKNTLRTSTATAIHPSTISRVKDSTFARLIRRDKAFSSLFVSYLVSRVGVIEADYADQVLNPSEKRLARILWSLASDGPDGKAALGLKVSQSTLAEMIGTTRSRVSYFMNRFRKMGLIDYNGTVHALPALHKFLMDTRTPR